MKALKWLIVLLLWSTLGFGQSIADITEEANRLLDEDKYEEFQNYIEPFLDIKHPLSSFDKSELAILKAESMLFNNNSDKAMSAYQYAYTLAKESKNFKVETESALAMVQLFIMKDQPNKAINMARYQLNHPSSTLLDQSSFNALLGGIYFTQGVLDSTRIFQKKALDLSTLAKDTASLAQRYRSYSKILTEFNELDSALIYAIDGLKFTDPYAERDKLKIFTLLINISQIFQKQGNYYKAEEYGKFSLDTCKYFGLQSSKASSYGNLGHIEFARGHFEKAISFSDSALATISESQFNQRSKASFQLLKLKSQLMLEGKMDDTLYQDILSKKEQFKNSEVLHSIHILEFSNRSRFMSPNEFDSRYQELLLENQDDYNRLSLKQLLKIKLNFQKQNNNLDALITQQHIDSINELILNKNQEFLVHDLEAKYRKAEQEKEITQQSIEINSKNELLFAIFSGLALAILLLSLTIFFYVKLSHQKKALAQSLSKNEVLLKEKDTLLREIHHRVKNNLQVVSSLLSWQSRETKDDSAKLALSESTNRVKSMSLIHQHLYSKENLTGIRMKLYFESLIQNLVSTYQVGNRITFDTDIEDLNLDVDTVVPLGLAINELITNSIKYAFTDGSSGSISVSLKEKNHQLHFTVRDNGIGIKDTSLLGNSDSFGYELIQAFSQRLDAELKVNGENGTSVEMIISDYKINV